MVFCFSGRSSEAEVFRRARRSEGEFMRHLGLNVREEGAP